MSTTTTAQTIVNACQQDMMNTIGTNNLAVLDYVNRTQLDMLRVGKWKFLESAEQYFITSTQQTDYEIVDATGAAFPDRVNTNLGLTLFGSIKKNSVRDLSNFRYLKEVIDTPSSI